MADLFADTSGWGNLVDASQPYHDLTADLYVALRRQGRKLVTTNYILAELIALLTSPLRIPRARSIEFIDRLRKSPYVEVVHIDSSTDAEAWQLLKSYSDKDWSLVDCASFVMMRRLGIVEALTTDHHFEQAGLVRLLK
jgi:predicted nucleic acid-binding protein